MNRLTSFFIMCLVIVLCATVSLVVPPASADPDNLDDFGGFADKPVSTITTVNRNADGSAHATSVTALTLTDTSQSWTPDQFIGYNLQPNVGTHMYFEITGNTSNTITVMESDRTGVNYRGLNDYNDGDDEYRILEDWPRPHLEGDRYVLTSPQDNVFLRQGMNNFWDGSGTNGQGVDPHGYSLDGVLDYKYGATEPNEMYRIQTLKDLHFNALGEYTNPLLFPGADADVPPEYYMPYIELIRPSIYWRPSYSWPYASSVEIQPGTVFQDAFDPDWPTAVFGSLDSSAFQSMGATQQAHHITPYNAGWKNCAASPYCMGIKVEDEPGEYYLYNNNAGVLTWVRNADGSRCTANFIHMGFHPFVSHITNNAEKSHTKAFYTNFLRAEYTDGGESAFVANIMFDGSDETTLWSDWPGVTGYVSSAKDSAALSNLNTAWGTNFETWEEVYKCDNANPDDTKTGSSNISFVDSNPDTITISGDTWDFYPTPYYIKVSGTEHNDGIYEIASYNTSTITVLASESLTTESSTSATLSTVGELYGKISNDKNGALLVDLTPNGPESVPRSSTPAQILADLNTMSKFYWRRWILPMNAWRDDRLNGKKHLTVMHQDFGKAPDEKVARWYGWMSEDYATHYIDMNASYGNMPLIEALSGETSMPIWTNTFWHFAVIDTPKGADGVVDEILYTVLIRGVTDASGNTGKLVMDSDTSDTVVVDRGTSYAATTLGITDNACTPGSTRWCATVFCNMDAEPVVCSDVAFHGGREGGVSSGALVTTKLYLTDEGVTGNSINYELRSYNKLRDADGQFVDPWEHQYDYRKLWYVGGQEKSLTSYDRAAGIDGAAMSCRIGLIPDGTTDTITINNYCQGGAYTCAQAVGQTCYGMRCTNLNHWLPIGTHYVIGTKLEASGCPMSPIGNLSQEIRGQQFYDASLVKFNYKNSAGHYYFLGQDWWSFWDYGSGYTENVNFGWATYSDNLYDSVENTELGADGTPGTRDDEAADYGNFTGTAKTFTQNLYSLLFPSEPPVEEEEYSIIFKGRVILRGTILK